jgi:Histone chaperone domain CHZ
LLFLELLLITPTEDEVDEDNMEEIDPSNIISSGRRTRGRQIDFAKAAQELPEVDDEDDDDDDDFEEPVADEDKMEE